MKINKLLIATHNPGKFKEINVHLLPLKLELVSLSDLGITEDYVETAETYEENALGKAKFYYQLSGLPTLADDSGLSVDALGGEPGVHSRNWPGHRGTDEELLAMLLDKMKDVATEKRTANFVTVVAYWDGEKEIVTRGEEPGLIADKQVCPIEEGFPYSSIFYPHGYDKVFSELSISDKNKISHRGRALNQFINKINI